MRIINATSEELKRRLPEDIELMGTQVRARQLAREELKA